jgi:hypothetical protein
MRDDISMMTIENLCNKVAQKQNMLNNTNKKRRRSRIATLKRPSNKKREPRRAPIKNWKGHKAEHRLDNHHFNNIKKEKCNRQGNQKQLINRPTK